MYSGREGGSGTTGTSTGTGAGYGSGSDTIDWSRASLPKNWERRADPKSHKVYYVDHQTRKTQWKHPHDTNSNSKNAPKKENLTTSRNVDEHYHYDNDDDYNRENEDDYNNQY